MSLKSIGKYMYQPGYALNRAGKFMQGKDPAKEAMPYLDQIPGQVQPYYQPYIDQGQEAGQQAGNVYQQMAQDPTSFYAKLMSSYSPSEGFQYQKNQLNRSMGNTAAAGGFSGTVYDQRSRAEMLNALMSKDKYDWLERIMGLQGRGLEGQQHQADIGYNASTGYGDILGNLYNAKAGLQFQGAQAKNQQRSDLLKSLISLGGMAAGGAAGGAGGAAMGGRMFAPGGSQYQMGAPVESRNLGF